MRNNDSHTQSLIVPALGGVERILYNWGSLPKSLAGFAPHHTWHPDGKHIAYTVPPSGSQPAGLNLLDLDTGTAARLTSVGSGSYYDRDPVFFSNGSKLAFVRLRSLASGTVEVLTLADNSIRSYRVDSQVFGITIAPGEKELLLTTNGPLLRLRLGTGVVTAAEPLLRPVQRPSFSADGRRRVFQQATRDNNIWHFTLDRPGHAGPAEEWIASTYPYRTIP